MSKAPITYDLVVLLDPQADEPARAKVLADAKAAIEAHGELLRQDQWGLRALTYPIAHRTEAEYHLFQFHVSDKSVLESLDRSLHLSDEVLRFMISKLAPGTPEAPPNPDTRAVRHAPAEPEPAAAA
ncbi:MAG TPA: 30S ribosomal protein S6 [Solirubrobacteraceae bacterium]|jgi:small subunit ribosomal protein S6|nr:30S ribosomal protein S6 [Solirubrobacteraceae bacterium]